jgi:hypothetical protein
LPQTEDFYNFADENGLLIWQDAMFGGSHYPRTKEWITDYAEEIAQQVCEAFCVMLCVFVIGHNVLRSQQHMGRATC